MGKKSTQKLTQLQQDLDAAKASFNAAQQNTNLVERYQRFSELQESVPLDDIKVASKGEKFFVGSAFTGIGSALGGVVSIAAMNSTAWAIPLVCVGFASMIATVTISSTKDIKTKVTPKKFAGLDQARSQFMQELAAAKNELLDKNILNMATMSGFADFVKSDSAVRDAFTNASLANVVTEASEPEQKKLSGFQL